MKRLVAVVLLCCVVGSTALFAQFQLDKGRELFNQGKTKEAIATVSEFLVANPKNVDAWLLLGEAYVKVSNLDSAKIAGQKVIALDETNLNGYLLTVKALRAQKDMVAAYNTLKAGLVERKNDPKLLAELGFVLLESDSVDRAIVVLSQAKEADPNAARLYVGLGDAYSKQGVPAFAITQFERSIELDSTRADVHYRLGKLYYRERRYNDAARSYQRVADLDTTNKDVLLELARMYMIARPKQYARAVQTLKLFVQRFPNSEEGWPWYAEALFYTRQYADAITAAQRTLKTDPKSEKALRFLASSQAYLRQYKESIESYNRLRAVDTLRVEDLKILGAAYEQVKNQQLALQTYEELIALDANQKEVLYLMGAILMNDKKWDRAAVQFQRAYTLDSALYNAFTNHALCKMVLAEYDSARIAFRYVTGKRPDYAPATLYLARSLSAMDSLGAARETYGDWLKLIKGDEAKNKREVAEAYKITGAAYLAEKRYAPAIENLKKSLQFRDDDVQVHLWLAQSSALSSNKEEAIREYRIVLRLDPKNKDAKNGLELLGIPVD